MGRSTLTVDFTINIVYNVTTTLLGYIMFKIKLKSKLRSIYSLSVEIAWYTGLVMSGGGILAIAIYLGS